MKLDWKIIVILVLLAGIIAAILFWPKPKTSEREVELAHENQTLKAQASTAVKAQKEIEEKLSINARKDSVAKIAFQIENKRLRAKIANIKPRVDSILIAFPVADTLFKAQDSLIQVQAHRIDSLTLEKLVLQKSFSALVMQKDTEIQSLLEINRNMDKIVDLKNKENRKLRRNGKLVKVVAVVGTIGGFLFGTSL